MGAAALRPASHAQHQRWEALVSPTFQLLFSFLSSGSPPYTVPDAHLAPLLVGRAGALHPSAAVLPQPQADDSAVLEPCPAPAADGSRTLPTSPLLFVMPLEPLELITVADYRSPGNNAYSDNY